MTEASITAADLEYTPHSGTGPPHVVKLGSAKGSWFRQVGWRHIVGIIALFFAIYGFVQSGAAEPNTFGLANLENPSDNLLHIVVAAWAFYSVRGGRQASMA